ncbi:hypothetical protein [Terrimonas pollutisoli]|uniref:hypothetical protein n=1 Tax=Terrimonas pollutisoli TaxID=3034147 RepID=UPI0023ECB931|nr:hypothetical protein [Terrimonas sp. H1YJ31]
MKALPAIFISSLIILLIACGKDKFETKPRLEIKDYNTHELFPGQTLTIRINYFDKEGDLGGAPVIGILKRLNLLPLGPDQDKADIFNTSLPEFPDKGSGEISFSLPYDFLKESTIEEDTLIFRFAVTDRAGNNSDTITSDQVVIRF